jgi:hypothetical protein
MLPMFDADAVELQLVTKALDMVAAAGCPQQPILVLQPSAIPSMQSANSPRFIMGRRLQGDTLQARSEASGLWNHTQY